MLPVISLDDEQFEEIMEKARKMIPNLYPEWTDYNYHDPGITILELMAWMKEMQQFHMDQIGPEHIKKYLMLLGEKQKGVTAARTMIWVSEPESDGWIPRGSRFFTGDIYFETTNSWYVQRGKITRIIAEGKSWDAQAGKFSVPMFGRCPQQGEVFELRFSSPLAEGKEHRLYFGLFHGYEVKRNPIGCREKFVPLAAFRVEYRHGGGFAPVERLRDETCRFLEDGFLCLGLEHRMEAEQDGEYCIRIILEEAQYDMAPVLEQVSVHCLETVQTRTLCEAHRISWTKGGEPVLKTDTFLGLYGQYEIYIKTETGWRLYGGEIKRWKEEQWLSVALTGQEVKEAGEALFLCFEDFMDKVRLLGEGNGFPGQEVAVELQGLCRDGLEILVETEEDSHVFRQWKQTDDFGGCGPEDFCYAFDEDRGILAFGDGIRGQVPRGRILLAAGHTCFGNGGNIKAGAIEKCQAGIRLKEAVNRQDAAGGKDRESLEECQARVHRELKVIRRAVTYADCEQLVRRTPGLMIERVRAIPENQQTKVTLVVKPCSFSPRPLPGQAFLENIRNMLEPGRLIGTRLKVVGPEYIGLLLFAEIETDVGYERIKDELRMVLEEYFRNQGNEFGQPVLYGDVYGILDVASHVTRVKSLSMDAQGSRIERSRNGDVMIPANGVAYLKEWDCVVCSAEYGG